MFSKALFKQSCKANGTMWGIITAAVCFMLACVMLISGNGNIGEVKNSIQDTIITKEIDAEIEERAINYYANCENGLYTFDKLFSDNAKDTLTYLVWYSKMPNASDFTDESQYLAAMSAWQNSEPSMQTKCGEQFILSVNEWQNNMPKMEDATDMSDYLEKINTWKEGTPLNEKNAVTLAYSMACEDLQAYIKDKAKENGYKADSDEELEMIGSVMYVLNPNGMFNDFYTENGEDIPEDYDYMSLIEHISANDIDEYINSIERVDIRNKRASEGAAIFLAGNMSKSESVDKLLEALSSYGVTKEKYDTFGYTYESLKHMSMTANVTYESRLDYELDVLKEKYENGEYKDNDAYMAAVDNKRKELKESISSSFLSTLPSAVSDALEEIGKADLYTLIVGSIFYKLAGLLLPIIYMIMASNNLVAGQVDSGSMAYVLSTSTKRSTVVFTQAVYLIGSLFAMFSLTTITGCVCLSLVSEEIELTYGNLILLNVGAFLVLLALSGLCFFTSCVFDRSKRSMAIGGGLSIFALVAAMLGLFGSPVIPSVVRLDALNNFNYTTIISLFDVISIIDGTSDFIWKFIILGVAGIIGYVAGSLRFIKKDLPL